VRCRTRPNFCRSARSKPIPGPAACPGSAKPERSDRRYGVAHLKALLYGSSFRRSALWRGVRRYKPRHHLLAYGLAALAGFVDSLGFLKLSGLFVSFMSGNSTRLTVGLASNVPGSVFAGGLIAAFVGGVMTGASVANLSGRLRKQAVLGLIMSELALAAVAVPLGGGASFSTLLMACAMGSANTVFQRNGEVAIGVTYMTGTLVKLGQHLAAALSGGPRFTWAPYLLLWLSLLTGAVSGASVFRVIGLEALWIAVAVAALLLAGAAALGPTLEE
jgi:uncharacterized membrane protein YoaK (UPF0700 family)